MFTRKRGLRLLSWDGLPGLALPECVRLRLLHRRLGGLLLSLRGQLDGLLSSKICLAGLPGKRGVLDQADVVVGRRLGLGDYLGGARGLRPILLLSGLILGQPAEAV